MNTALYKGKGSCETDILKTLSSSQLNELLLANLIRKLEPH